MPKIRVLSLSGSSYEMGFQHGQAYRQDIIHFAEERIRLSGSPEWAGQTLSRTEVLTIAENCLPAHRTYAPELYEELRGMSDATGLSVAELIVCGGFTDFIDTVYAYPAEVNIMDECTAFLVPNEATETNLGFYGQTWDMHDSATPHVILLDIQPTNGSRSLVFTTTGCVGMIGMNDAGVAVGINNLKSIDGRIGVTWPFVIRKILAQTNVDAALDCIRIAELAGAHNYLLMDKTGKGYSVEAMPTRTKVTPLQEEPIVHTNHCLWEETLKVALERPLDSQRHSEQRLEDARDHLLERPVTLNKLKALTRDTNAICTISKPPRHVESCGAAIMRPATGDFWAVWGVPHENEYEHFKVAKQHFRSPAAMDRVLPL